MLIPPLEASRKLTVRRSEPSHQFANMHKHLTCQTLSVSVLTLATPAVHASTPALIPQNMIALWTTFSTFRLDRKRYSACCKTRQGGKRRRNKELLTVRPNFIQVVHQSLSSQQMCVCPDGSIDHTPSCQASWSSQPHVENADDV